MKKSYLSLLFILCTFIISAQNIAYVTPTGAGNLSGNSWLDAYPADSLQAAIDKMSNLSGGQVWVATGTYYPTVPYDGDYSNPRKKSFSIQNDVEVYGGFSGFETALAQRSDFGEGGTNETILSGDIGVLGDNSDNSFHVVYAATGISNALIDGFTIQDGNANSSSPNNNGGGIWTRGAIVVQNCVVRNNFAIRFGGGIFIDENNIVNQSIIHTNTGVERGGGVYLLDYSLSGDTEPIIKNSLIYNNNTTHTSGQGGGVHIRGGNGRVINCRVIANQSRRGGGIYHWYGGESINCIVAHNFANFGGGGIYIERGGITVGNTVVSNRSNNTASGWGIFRNHQNTGYTSIARNCILWNNGNDTKQFHVNGTDTGIEYSATQGGYTGSGAGSGIINLQAANSGTDGLNYPEFINPHTTQGYNAALIPEFLNADWRLNCHSACIDSASASLIPPDINFDFDGNARIKDGNGDGVAIPDMGAFEYFAEYSFQETICQGDTLFFAGTPLTSSGTYYDTLTSSHNCDSIISLTLTVLPNDTGFVQAYICLGDTFTYAMQHYTQSGVYYQTAPNPNGCDSIIQITLQVHPVDTVVFADTGIYENQIFYFYGQNITVAGTYYHTLKSINNCDSVLKQTVYIIPVDTVLYDTLCQGNVFAFEGTNIYTGGTYYAVIPSVSLTDSVIQLNLTEIPVDTTVLDVVYLNHGSSYNFHGTQITSPGTYYHTLVSVWGCDSILQLRVMPRRYVTQNGAGVQNGHNWANAYAAEDLQMAIFNVAVAGGGQVWVAKGTYKPTTGADRTHSFIIYNNVELYGGFAGTESSINNRAFYGLNQINETRLSGDINTPNDSTDNSYNIVKQQMVGYILIDGFTIRDACNPYWNGEGSGVYLREGGILRNCIIINNHTGYKGGGVYNAGGTITDCIITQNRSGSYGGGVCMHGGTITNSTISHNITGNGGAGIQCQFTDILIENCQINNNSIDGYGWGGGVNVETSHKVTIKNCSFTGNQGVLGGALSNTGTAGLLIVDSCTFHANSAVDFVAPATGNVYDGIGGALRLSKGHVTNATFTNNTATKGGAARLFNSVLIENSIFINNAAVEEGGGAYFYESGNIRYCTFSNNSAKRGGGAYLQNGGTLSDCLFTANTATNMGGGAYLNDAGNITRSEFIDNFAHHGGAAYITGNALLSNSDVFHNKAHYNGGGIYNASSSLSVLNCKVFNNFARFDGGGLYSNNQNAKVANSIFYNNEAERKGGGAYLYFGGKLVNCNISRNKADDDGGGVFIEYRGDIKNSVIWGNNTQVDVLSFGFNIEIDTTAIQGGYAGDGAGNLLWNVDTMNTGTDPVHYVNFIQPTNFIGNAVNNTDSLSLFTANWGLNCGSALIDAGRNNIFPDTIHKDLAGNSRFFDGNGDGNATIDLGPLEANFNYFYELYLCEGDTFTLGSQYLTQAGIYTDTLLSASGCDSIVSIALTIYNTYTHTTYDTIYDGDAYAWQGQLLTSTGTYYDSLPTINGCDSVFILYLYVKPICIFTETVTICDGQYFSWRGNDYSVTGIYYDSLTTSLNCDSVYVLELTVSPAYLFVTYDTICEGAVYHWQGQSYTLPDTYYDSLTSVHNCDSVYVLHLTVKPKYENNHTATICDGQIYTWRGHDYAVQGNYYDSLNSTYGCDSVFILQLFVNASYEFTQTGTICQGDAFNWRGHSLTVQGTFYDSLTTTHNCDSVYVLELTMSPAYSFVTYDTICEGAIYHWQGQSYTLPGTYYDSLISVHNCDSIYVLHLTEKPKYENNHTATICDGQVYTWRGHDYAIQGTYYDSLNSTYGCDSVFILQLSVNASYEFTQTETICQGDAFNWRGHSLTVQGTFYDSLTTTHNCDSVYVLELTMSPAYSFVTYDTICEGALYHWQGQSYTLPGTYYDSLSTINGCDSLFVLNLFVNDLPLVSLMGLDTFYCLNHGVSIISGVPAGGTFSGQGVSGHEFNSTVAGIGTWPIVYTYTDSNGCTNSDTVWVEVDDCVNTMHHKSLGINLFPNPNDGSFTIEIDEDSKITLINAMGTVLYEAILNKGSHLLDFPNVTSGVYLLKAEGRVMTKVLRVVVNK